MTDYFFFVFFCTGMTLFLRADHWDSSLETLKAGQSKALPRGKESGIKNSGLACMFGGESGAKRENRELFFFSFLSQTVKFVPREASASRQNVVRQKGAKDFG